jgi:hypothetical protein
MRFNLPITSFELEEVETDPIPLTLALPMLLSNEPAAALFLDPLLPGLPLYPLLDLEDGRSNVRAR